MLTQLAIQHAKPRAKSYKLSDGQGLCLLVQPTGTKAWRFRYRYFDKENMLALGSYPEVSLAEAREQRTAIRKLLAAGIDPSQHRKQERFRKKAAMRNAFSSLADDYIEQLRELNRAPRTIEKNVWLLKKVAAPLAHRPITDITPHELLALLKKIEKAGKRETAVTLKGTIGSVFRFAIANLRAQNDPTYPLRGALLPPVVKHRAAITDEVALGGLMAAIDEYPGWRPLRLAVLFLALTMTRPGDVRFAKRTEIIFPRSLWRIPAERMKMRRPHDVPLSTQALAIVREAWQLSEGSEYLFPAERDLGKPLQENAHNYLIRKLGYGKEDMTAHGFRASASTILNERRFDADVIEAALAHEDDNEVRAAYNRSTYLPQRIKLMQDWADLMDQFRLQAAEVARARA